VILRHAATLVLMAAVTAGLAACAPRLQPPGPVTQAPQLNGDALITADGASLPVRVWLPEGQVRAVILALHGFADYSNAFAIPAERWRGLGIATYAYDQRGFGAAPAPGLWPGVGTLVADMEVMIALVRRRHPGMPLYLLGESMGGGVVLAGLSERQPDGVAGAILVAPAVWGRETMPLSYRVLLWLAAHTMPWLELSGSNIERTPSDNIDMLRAMSRDPLVQKGARIDALYGVTNLMDAALAAAPNLEMPVLVLYGEKDDIIPREPTLTMLERMPAGRRVALYENGYHMLLRDLEAEVVQRDVAAWVADPKAPLPSGADRRDIHLLAED